jgi:hypothetical protein
MLRPVDSNGRPSSDDIELGSLDEPLLCLDRKLLWLWQSPMMLMSFSWVCFLVGYEFYLLTPLIYRDSSLTESTVRCGSRPPSILLLTRLTYSRSLWWQLLWAQRLLGPFSSTQDYRDGAIARVKEVDRPAMVSTTEVGVELAVPKS